MHVHQVVLVVPSTQKVKPSERVPHKIYQVPCTPDFLDEMIRLELEGNKVQLMLKASEVIPTMCEGLLNSTEVFEELQDFDLLVHDTAAFGAVSLGEHLGIPRVEIMPVSPNNLFASYFHAVPIPVSYVPELMTGFSDKMTFVERAINFGVYLGVNLFVYFAIDRPMNALKVKYNIKPERSYLQAARDTELVIITADFALEYPQPLLPGNVMVGPLSVRDGRPLPPELEKFVSNSGGHGFIIVSFGSNVASILSRKAVDMLAAAFGKLKQKVVWRLKGYIPSFLGANIKIVDWLPQNDLLAHKDIKAFVSHVGHNSLYESTYHGVPLVAFPLFGDQQSNAKKAQHFGLGLAVDHKTSNTQQLFETIERVITEPRFKSKAMHISGLLKDRRRTPLQETCDWIEYVLRHGGARHFRPQVLDIPWYQYYLLDVIAFIVAIATMVVVVIRLACRCLCRVCCRKGDSKTKKD
ncbi:2-hydroxyacylsphingosine 1-beta-galactosyltransferase-like [Orbicella faveolata]|uniref:2-hydroxyacylsphingosine 1-beta-galactosyltransferase-like n=1 Tax=Orbicella faveolata TaxID=48498 RepID=UPI0009E23AA0|nr:2-hydroxyacylsphingosine 1-beta-galactosyltransferase-like [Orbicella faveolata]